MKNQNDSNNNDNNNNDNSDNNNDDNINDIDNNKNNDNNNNNDNNDNNDTIKNTMWSISDSNVHVSPLTITVLDRMNNFSVRYTRSMQVL